MEAIEASVIFLLGVLAEQDMESNEIEGIWLIPFPLLGLLRIIGEGAEPRKILPALVPGCILIVMSFLTKEAIGEGDSLLFLGLGFVFPLETCMRLLFLSSLMAGAESAVILWRERREERKTGKTVPMIPMIFAAMLLEAGIRRGLP